MAGQGLRGDRYFDFRKDYKGQITFFAAEVFEKLCANFGINDKPAGILRRNVIVSGVDLLSLIGREFEIQGVTFRGTQHCAPCEWMNVAFAPGAEEFLKDNAGLRAQILSDGTITVGDARLSIPSGPIQTRSPECLWRDLKVSSAMPDLSSSPKPSAIISSYCSLVARASGRSSPVLVGELECDAAVLGGVGGGKEAGVIAVLHVLAVGLQHARVGAGLGKDFAQHGEIEPERVAQAETFGEAGGVDVHHHVDQRLHLRGLARSGRHKRSDELSSFSIGFARRKASSLPPHMR